MKNLTKITAVIIVVGLAVGFTTLTAFKTEKRDTPSFVDNTVPMLEGAKTYALELVDAMPEDKFDYQPTEVNKTFGAQMVHIGYTMKYFQQAMLEGKQVKYEEPNANEMSKAEIRTLVEEGFDGYIAAVKKLSDEDLAAELPFGPNKTMTRAQSILFANDHATNHRAKANLYLRMNDMEPPKYGFL